LLQLFRKPAVIYLFCIYVYVYLQNLGWQRKLDKWDYNWNCTEYAWRYFHSSVVFLGVLLLFFPFLFSSF